MDLDRAKQETSSLRALLREHDITVPASRAMYEDEVKDFQSTVMSLEAEYEQFQAETKGPGYEANQINETLANEVHRRVALNKSLKERLSQAIGKGERDQELSATKINEMQARLRVLEETVMLAQQHAEEEVTKHEQEINALKQSHNSHLLRANGSVRSPGMLSPILPNSPFSGARSPRLSQTSSGPGLALSQAVQIHDLEAKVKGLEKALRDADMEMGEVVSRMNQAQIEVAELQFAR
jgi:predicted  nucleic acid-binding Zn-ribbon protein